MNTLTYPKKEVILHQTDDHEVVIWEATDSNGRRHSKYDIILVWSPYEFTLWTGGASFQEENKAKFDLEEMVEERMETNKRRFANE